MFYIGFIVKKMSNVSESLRRLLTKNERPWAIRSGRSPKMSEWLVFFEWIAHSPIFSQNTSDLLRKPMSEFPALQKRLPLFQMTRWTESSAKVQPFCNSTHSFCRVVVVLRFHTPQMAVILYGFPGLTENVLSSILYHDFDISLMIVSVLLYICFNGSVLW